MATDWKDRLGTMQEDEDTQAATKSSKCPEWLFNTVLILLPALFVLMVFLLGKPHDPKSPEVVVVPPSGNSGSALAPAPAPSPSDPAPAPVVTVSTGSPEKGEALYNTNCMACHQPEGKGKVGFAPYIRNPDFLAMTLGCLPPAKHHAGTSRNGHGGLGSPRSGRDQRSHRVSARGTRSSRPRRAQDRPRAQASGRDGQGRGALRPVLRVVSWGECARLCRGRGRDRPSGMRAFSRPPPTTTSSRPSKHGRRGTAMRPFSGSRGLANLSDGEIGDIIAFLRNADIAPPVVAGTSPDPTRGKMHFDANCAACHQPNGAGRPGIAPSIGNRDFLALASDDFIKNTVRQGRLGTSMVQRPDLSDAVLDDIVAYLRSLPVENVGEASGGRRQGPRVPRGSRPGTREVRAFLCGLSRPAR